MVSDSSGEKVKAAAYVATVASVSILAVLAGFTREQVLSVTVLAMFIAGSLFYWPFRNAFALLGISLLFFLRVLDVEHFIEFAHLDVVVFIIGMMIIIGALEEREFFDWLIARLVKPFMNRPKLLVIVILMLGFLMAALVDEVTSILFMMTIVIRITQLFDVNPIPFILFLVFTTNIGSSATVVGNPIGVLIAFNAAFTFTDFLRWSAPEAVASALLTSIIGVMFLSAYISKIELKIKSEEERRKLEEMLSVEWSRRHRNSLILFLGVLVGLVLHHQLERILGLPRNSLLLGVPLLGAAVSLFVERSRAREIVERRVDWWTLLYFILLFASVGTMKFTGVTEIIAMWIYELSKGSILLAMALIGAVAGLLTAFMDNVLAVATMIPIVEALADKLNVFMVWWTLLKAGTYWGNATVIGSTANIVAAGFVERRYRRGFSMKEWVKIGVPVSLITYLIAFAWLYAQHGMAPVWTPSGIGQGH
jgi:Na+/H+ antiporter NhaD/arsenite permease-like protein